MLILLPKDIKTPQAFLVSNAVPALPSKHHLVAAHKVKDDILQIRNVRFGVHFIKIHLLASRHLHQIAVFDVVNEPTLLDLVEHFPNDSFCVFFFFLAEEEDEI